jgi:hypothetical protein
VSREKPEDLKLTLKALVVKASQITPFHLRNPFSFKSQDTFLCSLKTTVSGLLALALKPELKASSPPSSPYFREVKLNGKPIIDHVIEGGLLLGKSSDNIIVQREAIRLWRPRPREESGRRATRFVSSIVERELAQGEEVLIYIIFKNSGLEEILIKALGENPLISIGKNESLFQVQLENVRAYEAMKMDINLSETPVPAQLYAHVKNSEVMQLHPLTDYINRKYAPRFYIIPYMIKEVEKNFTIYRYKPIEFSKPVQGYVIHGSEFVRYISDTSII